MLPKYYSPDQDTCEYVGLQMWTPSVQAGRYRDTGMLLNYCPWCGKDLSVIRELPEWITEEE